MNRLITLLISLLIIANASGQLIINEVLYDPSNNALDGDANGDGVYSQEGDSFIELFNTSNTNFDASGYQVWDDTTTGLLKFVVPAGTFVPPNGALVIFGSGPLVGNFGGAIMLSADTSVDGLNLNNSGEVIVIKDANGNTVLSFDSDALSNNPNESYTRFPDITGGFIQHNDTTPLLFSPGTRTDGTPFDTLFVVESLVVSSQSGATTIDTLAGTLQLGAMVMPAFADDQSVTWSVPSGNGVATVDANGLVSAQGNGMVMVTATTNDGTNISDSIEITVSNQSVNVSNLINESDVNIYPNPASSLLNISGIENLNQIEVYDLQGSLKLNQVNSNAIDISSLMPGSYIIKMSQRNGVINKVFIKE